MLVQNYVVLSETEKAMEMNPTIVLRLTLSYQIVLKIATTETPLPDRDYSRYWSEILYARKRSKLINKDKSIEVVIYLGQVNLS